MSTASHRFFHLSLTGAALGRLEEAERYYLAGNLNEALAAAQQAWREHPREPDVFRVLAYIHMARGEYPPAAQAAYQAVVIDGENPASYATLAQVYVTFNMLGNAEETVNQARLRFPDDPALLVLAADLRFRQRRDDDAARLARQALTRNPADNYARALLGVHALRKRRYDEARELLAAAVQAYPQRWDYLRDYGIALLNLGRHVEARRALLSAFRLYPADPSLQQHLHYALAFSGARGRDMTVISFYFYNTAWLGWVLFFLGLCAALIGLIMSLVQLQDLDRWTWMPTLILLAGLALLWLATPGIAMRQRRGKRFEQPLWKALEAEWETAG